MNEKTPCQEIRERNWSIGELIDALHNSNHPRRKEAMRLFERWENPEPSFEHGQSFLPCPFCGCNDGRVELQTDHTVFQGMIFEGYPHPVSQQSHGHRVRCGACGCQTCWWHYENEAIESWNKRSTKINAMFETVDAPRGLVGVTRAPIKRIDREDDGSVTVIIDHWPQPECQHQFKETFFDDEMRRYCTSCGKVEKL